ncbi:NAD-dependent epimerase/dehydratase family protein [Castellaniella sp. S9]|uniref:NAD-dependent epimerase/dehydratase family protein n=1 Tax=Castellaniella sp. S9 TaxID=2993652 RepID=UPI0022B4CE14|nr:NAD(P)-dependent oxidoreductase [Castellaniella sp. S9]
MSRKILVTGASGWLGIAIVKALLARGDHVVSLDLRSSPASIELAAAQPALTLVEADLGEWSQVVDVFITHQPTAVVHTAAIVGVVLAADVPIKALRVNTEGSINLFEAMRHHGVKRVVHVSTEETYGDFTAPIITEEHPQKPTSIYGLTKLATEHYGRIYTDRYGLECINARTCWVYGPKLPRARVPKVFIDAALEGTAYHLKTGGDLAVDQVYIDDTVAGVLLALDKENHRFDAYHIATGQAPTIDDVARLVREFIPDADVSTAPGPYLHGDQFPTARKGALDISRAQAELGYSPRYDLRAGIEKSIRAAKAERTGASSEK